MKKQLKRQYRKDQWQKDFLAVKGDKILCTGRQVGKSVICSEDAGEYAVNNPETEPIVMIAPTERQAYGLFEKTLEYLANEHPTALVKRGLDRPTKTRIVLKSGVRIYCLPVGKSGLGVRFLTIGRLYVDEASRVPEDVWSAIEPALLTTGGSTIMLSTPAGAQGEFWKTWINTDKAYDSFTRFSIDSEKVVREREICDSWTQKTRERALIKLEQAKKRWSKNRYAQEYMGEFVEDLHRWFSDKIIKYTCILKRQGFIPKGQDYFMGCDIARMGEDAGTCEIIKKNSKYSYSHVENIVTKKKLTTETEELIIQLCEKYTYMHKVYIDAGAGTLGVSVFDHLLKNPITKRKVVAINNAKRPMDKDGKAKSKLMKEDLYDNLLSMMQKGEIKLLDDEDIIASLRSVQYEYVTKKGLPTTLRIFGNDTHIVEGLIRACWAIRDKHLNIAIHYV